MNVETFSARLEAALCVSRGEIAAQPERCHQLSDAQRRALLKLVDRQIGRLLGVRDELLSTVPVAVDGLPCSRSG